MVLRILRTQHLVKDGCYVEPMDCPAFLEWSRTLSNARLDLARVQASRPKVRGTSRRFENDLELAQHEVSWTESWLRDHLEKCEVCKSDGRRPENAF